MPFSLSHTHRQWPAWFKGDFHAHTNHSDGVLSPPELLAEARQRNLDFFSITDHNVISAYGEFGEHDDMLIIPGVEVTMKYGHFNVFGVVESAEWLETLPSERAEYEHHMATGESKYSSSGLMAITKAAGLYNAINHPIMPPWDWNDFDTDLRNVHFLELYNDPTWPTSKAATARAMKLWSNMLNAGIRLTGIGGTDFHNPNLKPQRDGALVEGDMLNDPTTYVFAQNLSAEAILKGVVSRQVILSRGPKVAFGATLGDQTFAIGSDIGSASGNLQLSATVRHDAAITLQLNRNGIVVAEAGGTGEVSLRTAVTLNKDEPAWFRLDVRTGDGDYAAVTNPIFTGPQPKPDAYNFGAYMPK